MSSMATPSARLAGGFAALATAGALALMAVAASAHDADGAHVAGRAGVLPAPVAFPATPAATAPVDGVSMPAFLAHVEHEIVRVQANGITRIERWQDVLARDGRTVWVERILPAASGHDGQRGQEEGHRGHGHRHFDGDSAARWVTLGTDATVSLSLVDRHDRVVVSIPPAEFRTLGFDGRFDAAASLVPPSVIATMAPDPDRAAVESPVAGRWLLDRSDGWVHHVLWSDALQLALQIDSRRDDGTLTRTVRVRVEAPEQARPDSSRPWRALNGYERRRYDEYLD